MSANSRPLPALPLVVLAAALTWPAYGQFAPFGTASAHSVSGQFVVHSGRANTTTPGGLGGDGKLLRLEPSFTVVSCERIKQALADALGSTGPWRRKIYLSLQPARSAEDDITFICERFKDGWGYRLNVPNPVEPIRFVRAVVQALLLEQANRNATERAAEIPLWLSEGLAQQIISANGPQMLLAPPQMQVNRITIRPTMLEERHINAVTHARRALNGRGPLTLEELSWPKENQLAGPEAEAYGLSAQLFVAELLQFPDGAACVGKMLAELPGCLNWQTAFLRAFQPHFERQLDVEKWWTLQIVHFTGRDPAALRSPAESWVSLDELLQVPAEVRSAKSDLPTTARVPLGTVIRDWDLARQVSVLQGKLAELDLARQRTAEEFLPLVDDYRRLLANYLNQRNQSVATLTAGKMNTRTARSVVLETLRRLEALEQQREKARPASLTTAAQVEKMETPRP